MADDYDFDEDDFAENPEDGVPEGMGDAITKRRDKEDSLGLDRQSIRDWLTARRGWILIIGLAISQAVFATILIHLRSRSTPVAEIREAAVRDFATDMLGYEVKVNQIYQLLPMRDGKRMTVGLDLVMVLGQLPEERVEGAPRPNAEEMALFVATLGSMEPSIRSLVNQLLQQTPQEDFGSVNAQTAIKTAVRDHVNDTLERLDFGEGLRPGIGKRRVTDVLLPMFVTQYM